MLTEVAIIILVALLGNLAFNKLGLPGILGMIATGILLGPSGLDLIDPGIHGFLQEAKTVALIVILIRAGLGISKETLNRIGGPAIRMSFVPGLLEGTAVTVAAYYLLELPFPEAGMLGFIIAAVSPAVVVPSMLQLKEGGFGKKKEVPTLVLAGASVDDVFAITIFGIFAGIASGSSTGWGYLLVGVPGGIALGAALGAAIGFVLVRFFERYHMRDTKKVIIFAIVAVVFYDLAEDPAIKAILPIAALLGIMAIGFVILERNNGLANRLAAKFGKIWVLAEILLFVYIGTEVQLGELNGDLIGVGLLTLTIGLAARSFGVWLALMGSDLSRKERLFCVIAYWPKATVQAAMGAVPLAMVVAGKMTSMTVESGQTILAIAVLSIVVTAPLGAAGIKSMGPRLLTQE
ncbi:MAG: cation:proton antiporter [Synechococcus sp.]